MLGAVELPLALLLWTLLVLLVLLITGSVLMVIVGMYEEHKNDKIRKNWERVVRGER